MSQSKPAAPIEQSVPAAKISFAREDRRWIAERIEEVLESGQLTLGPYGDQLERGFAKLCGVPHGVAVSSGTAALEIVLRTLGVENRDVLVPANTFFATAAAVLHAGGTPVLMDTDPETLGTTPEELERRITDDTVGVIAVHIGGTISPRMKELQETALAARPVARGRRGARARILVRGHRGRRLRHRGCLQLLSHQGDDLWPRVA